jgi:hypothetical protein
VNSLHHRTVQAPESKSSTYFLNFGILLGRISSLIYDGVQQIHATMIR